MQKEKLRTVRKKKGYTHQQIADIIATDVSNYSRKESGDVKIVQREWDKIAAFLEVPLEEIYEEEEGVMIVNNNNSTFNDSPGAGSNVHTFNNELSISLIKNLQEYIALLKEEVSRLSEKQNKPGK
ncbi:transcriptional regulator [Chryseobacterium shigense]|uniref:Helix-turn-helix n=1 Tax=Chryseobacterium shigense TaxID=297244 RepID=A0A1N7HX45_9FLAO|nr:helix-turn-helix transcriptional regulator [Chryseobacterium shigense]PQA92020.1 transcriptional regulator [Chryseobacterium shigense]SIS29341.1 Helix-turn-helix [Chryseobacterium shigense]